MADCEALPSLARNNPIVPVNIPVLIASTGSANQGLSSDIALNLGAVSLEIRNNASSTLIENTRRALHNVR
jgi:hypothetical protein